MQFMFSYKVKCGIPEVAEEEETFQWTIGQTTTNERSTSTQTETSYDFPIVLAPYMKTVSTAYIFEDQLSTDTRAR